MKLFIKKKLHFLMFRVFPYNINIITEIAAV